MYNDNLDNDDLNDNLNGVLNEEEVHWIDELI
jgi:hypothetical protein